MNPVHFVKIQQSDGTEEMFIKANEIERVIQNIKNYQTAYPTAINQEAINACEYALTQLKELLPK